MKIGLLCLEIGQFIKSITFDSNFISTQRVMTLWCFTLWCFTLWCTGKKMGFYLTLSSSAHSFVLLTRFICHFNRNISYLAFEWWIYLVICLLYFMESTDMVNITVDRLFSSLRWAQGDKNKLSTALITKPCLVMFSS